MTKKTIPYDFVFDYLIPFEVTVKPMFGLYALYINEMIVLILCQKKENPAANGVWIATTIEHHKSLKTDIPSLRPLSYDPVGITETGWQLIPADTDDFEKAVIKACELIRHGDLRIGKIPTPGKNKTRTKPANRIETKRLRP